MKSTMMVWFVYTGLWVTWLIYVQFIRARNKWIGRLGSVLLLVCWGFLTIGLVQRGLLAGHWPLTNSYEFALGFLWAMITIYLLLEVSWRERRAGAFVQVVALLVATYAVTRSPLVREIRPLLPALRSLWLQLHVLSAMIGYGALGVAAGLGLLRVVGFTSILDVSDGEKLPSDEEVDRTLERVIALGFPWITLAILTGGIWAQKAWGRYWGWDPKEAWALVIWLWYLLILHARSLRLWRGRRLAGLAVVGFGLVLFTFVGVPWLVRTVRLESLHVF